MACNFLFCNFLPIDISLTSFLIDILHKKLHVILSIYVFIFSLQTVGMLIGVCFCFPF